MATMYYRPYSADPMQPEENFPEEDAMENVLPEYEDFFKDDRARRKDRRNQTRPPRRHKGTNMPNQGQGPHPRTPADVIKRASEQPRRDTPTRDRDRDDPTTRDIIELESVATDQDGYTEPNTPSPPTSGKKKPVEEADRYRHALRHMGQDILALRQHTRQLEAANALLRRDLGGLGPLPLAVPTAPVAVGGTVLAGHPVASHAVAAAPYAMQHHGGPIAVPAGATIVTTTQPYGGGTTVVEETVTHPGGHVYTTHHGHSHGQGHAHAPGNTCPCPGPSCTVGNVPHVHVEEEVSTIPHPDLVDRYGALRAALHKAATEMIEYKDKVQRLQNEIIKRQDKEEEYLRLTKAHQTQAQLLQRLQERAQRTAKLEEALRNQEKVIEKLELLLRQQHSKDEAYEALAEENRRLRAELDNLRGELAHNYRGSQDEMERLHLYQLLDRAEAKIAALERQLLRRPHHHRRRSRPQPAPQPAPQPLPQPQPQPQRNNFDLLDLLAFLPLNQNRGCSCDKQCSGGCKMECPVQDSCGHCGISARGICCAGHCPPPPPPPPPIAPVVGLPMLTPCIGRRHM